MDTPVRFSVVVRSNGRLTPAFDLRWRKGRVKVVDGHDGRTIGYIPQMISGPPVRDIRMALIVRPQASVASCPRQYRRIKLLVRERTLSKIITYHECRIPPFSDPVQRFDYFGIRAAQAHFGPGAEIPKWELDACVHGESWLHPSLVPQ